MISQNLAVCLAHMGYRVCIVDTDETHATEKWSAAREEDLPPILVVSVLESDALGKTVKQLHLTNEVVIIDGTPSLSEMVTRIILVSDILLIPIRPGASDFRTMGEFHERYKRAKEYREHIPAYFILNEYTDNLNIHQAVRSTLESTFEDIPIMATSLRSRVAYAEAATNGTGVYEHVDQKAKQEMIGLTNDVLQAAQAVGLIQA